MRKYTAPALILAAAALVALVATAAAPAAAPAVAGDVARAAGIQLALPDGWSRVPVASERRSDPRTLLVIGTDGARPVQSDCQVASYRVPSDGAVVVVLGWRDSIGVSFPSLQAMKLRRATFDCFDGRGAFARITRADRDFQVNVLVGDRASSATIGDAFDAARSLALTTRS